LFWLESPSLKFFNEISVAGFLQPVSRNL